MEQIKFVFKSNGIYLGFIQNDFLFSRDDIYFGWIEQNKYVWDSKGRFVGVLAEMVGHYYILADKLAMPPLSKPPRPTPASPSIPNPPANISPITLPVGVVDAF